jgi:hypothetical protein
MGLHHAKHRDRKPPSDALYLTLSRLPLARKHPPFLRPLGSESQTEGTFKDSLISMKSMVNVCVVRMIGIVAVSKA